MWVSVGGQYKQRVMSQASVGVMARAWSARLMAAPRANNFVGREPVSGERHHSDERLLNGDGSL